jgi:hypothetical protein
MEQTHFAKISLRLLRLAGAGGRVSGSGDTTRDSYLFGGPEKVFRRGTPSSPCLSMAVAAIPDFPLGSVMGVGDSFSSAILGTAEYPLGFATLGELG